MAKRALGKGLGAIISSSATPIEDMEKIFIEDQNRVVEIDVQRVSPNPDQPRTHFDENEIRGLAESIKAVGLIQPIIVRRLGNDYVVIAGERRLRAVKLGGFKTVKAIVMEAGEEQNLTVALIENIQRADLNPVEEAKAYRVLINRFKLKQQDVAVKVGKDRATIANALRLLNLPDEIQEGLVEGKISAGHAKVLLGIEDPERLVALYREIVEKGLSVRALEAMSADERPAKKTAATKRSGKDSHVKQMEDKLISLLGTKVEIKHSGTKGRIEISYYSLDDFDRIMDIFKSGKK